MITEDLQLEFTNVCCYLSCIQNDIFVDERERKTKLQVTSWIFKQKNIAAFSGANINQTPHVNTMYAQSVLVITLQTNIWK